MLFDTSDADKYNIEETLLYSFNNLFDCLAKESLNMFNEFVNTRTLMKICWEMDKKNFNNMNFMYDMTPGIFYAEIKELIMKMLDILKKSGISLKSAFNELDSININSLIKLDKNEIKKLTSIFILYLFNCEKKDQYIDRIAYFDDVYQQELLKVVEKYMYLDESEKIISRNVSSRNTFGEYVTESDFTSKYMGRIDRLEKERDNFEREKIELMNKINENESEIELIKNEKILLEDKYKKLESIFKKKELEIDEYKRMNSDLNNTIKQLVDLTNEVKMIPELKARLDDKDAEIKQSKIDYQELEESHALEINRLNEEIDLLHENISRLSDMKLKYEKMKEAYKDYDVMKDRINYYEAINKDYIKLKMNYLSLSEEKNNIEKIITEYEMKLTQKGQPVVKKDFAKDDKEYKQQIDKKDLIIKELQNKIYANEDEIKNLENELFLRNQEIIKKEVVYKEVFVEKEVKDIIKSSDELLLDKIKNLENEIRRIKYETESEMQKKNEEIEFYKKDNEDTKDRYEKEFELMASSVYNLGLNYWSMKMEYTQKLNEKPTWLIKERQKYFNGDF